MKDRTLWMITIILLIWAALFLVAANAVRSHAQNPLVQRASHNNEFATTERDVMDEVGSARATASSGPYTGRQIVIGFVGDFVNREDPGHPEVQLAAELRRRYSSSCLLSSSSGEA